MTIAVGILALDGLVIAADTEESDGYLKTSVSKIRVSTSTQISAAYGSTVPSRATDTACSAIAGAGTAHVIDTATALLWVPALNHSKGSDADFRSGIGSPLNDFYRANVIPFAAYPSNERPDFDLLIGVTHRDAAPQDRHRLFVTHKTAVLRRSPIAAIGVGEMFARMLLKRLYPDEGCPDVRAAAALAAYVTFQVKESVPQCGKFTEIVVLSKGTRGYVRWKDIRDLETLFLEHGRMEGAALACALATSAKRESAAMKDLARAFRKFRASFGKLPFTKSNWLSPPLPE